MYQNKEGEAIKKGKSVSASLNVFRAEEKITVSNTVDSWGQLCYVILMAHWTFPKKN